MKLFSVAKGMEFFFKLGKVYIVIVGTNIAWLPKYGRVITNYKVAQQLKETFYVYRADNMVWYVFPKFYSEMLHDAEQHYVLSSDGDFAGSGCFMVPNEYELKELETKVSEVQASYSMAKSNKMKDTFDRLYEKHSIDDGRCAIIPVTELRCGPFRRDGYIYLKHLIDTKGNAAVLYIKLPEEESAKLSDTYLLRIPASMFNQFPAFVLSFLREVFWDNGFTKLKKIVLEPA